MDANAAAVDVEMEQHGGVQAYLDSLTARLNRADNDSDRDSDEKARSASHDAIAALLEEAANSFECRFINCLHSLLEHWAFVAEKIEVCSADSSTEKRSEMRDEAERLGRAVGVSFVSLVGASTRCSYLHAFAYAFPHMIFILGHILRASME
eukprot:6194006-Pleurochrysis_carterae.AAC.1